MKKSIGRVLERLVLRNAAQQLHKALVNVSNGLLELDLRDYTLSISYQAWSIFEYIRYTYKHDWTIYAGHWIVTWARLRNLGHVVRYVPVTSYNFIHQVRL